MLPGVHYYFNKARKQQSYILTLIPLVDTVYLLLLGHTLDFFFVRNIVRKSQYEPSVKTGSFYRT